MKSELYLDSIVDLNKSVLAYNDRDAMLLRERFLAAGVNVVNLISSPGTGKTEIVIGICEMLSQIGVRVAVIVGDCATDNDAIRISKACRVTRQIITEGICHLEALMISEAVTGWDLSDIDLLLIENVGNLVCPSDFDLGENLKVALLSVTEGEDKPLKYPALFSSADLIVVTKVDLINACGMDIERMRENFRAVNPDAEVVETSARTGEGVQYLAHVLISGEEKASYRDDEFVVGSTGRKYT